MADLLTAEDFQRFVGMQFSIAGRPDRLELTSVERHKSVPGLRQPFTVLFSGPRGNVTPEGLYRLTTDDGASFELYIIPILTIEGDRQDYQCAFN